MNWTVVPEVRTELRLTRVRDCMDEGRFTDAVIEVEELLDEQPDHVDALFLLGESLLEVGDAEGAIQAYEHVLAIGDEPDPLALTGMAIARFESCQLVGASEAAREAVRRKPDHAEAHYYLSLALERLGRASEAAMAFAAAHQLDPEAFPAPLRLDPDDWVDLLVEATERLSPELQAFWDGVHVEFIELPDLDELRRSDPPIPPTVPGLYVGDPPPEPDGSKPRALRLFTRNLGWIVERDALIDEMVRTLEQEAADWLGLPTQ